MNIKKVLKFGLPLLGLSAIATTLPITLTSCSDSKTDIGVKTFNALVANDTNQPQSARNNVRAQDTAYYITSPSLNRNALELAKQTFGEISKSQLQKDFNTSITRIYDAYEFEFEEHKHNRDGKEIEASIENIRVIDKYDGDKSNLTWKIEVEYEVEINDHDSIVKQTRLFKINPQFANNTYIQELKDVLSKKEDSDIHLGDQEIDLGDLYEFYFGDNDDIDDLDDVGIFDLMNLYRKNYKASEGSLLGYQIDLLALKPVVSDNETIVAGDYTKQDAATINSKESINNKTKTLDLFTPSISHNYFFYADQSNLPKMNGEKINLLLDSEKLTNVSFLEFSEGVNGTMLEKPETKIKPLEFISLFKTQDSQLDNNVNSEQNGDGDTTGTTPEEKPDILGQAIKYLNSLMIQNSSLIPLSKNMFGTNGSIKVTQKENHLELTYDFGDKQTDEHYSKVIFYLDENLFKNDSQKPRN